MEASAKVRFSKSRVSVRGEAVFHNSNSSEDYTRLELDTKARDHPFAWLAFNSDIVLT